MSRLSSPVHETRRFKQPASGQHHRGAARATTSDRDDIAKTGTLTFVPVTKSKGKKGQTTLFTFTVTLSTAYDLAETMSFRTMDGTATISDGDYIAKTGTLTLAPRRDDEYHD